jgi:hypothetical protein
MTPNRRIRRADPQEAPFLTEISIRLKADQAYSEAFMTAARPELEFPAEEFVPD